jgi:hypothetical protein
MKNKKLYFALFALILPFILSLACAFGGPPAIGNVTAMTGDGDNAQPTTTYQPTDTFFISVEANNMVVGSVIKVQYKREGQLYDEGTTITTKEAGSSTWNFSAEPPTSGQMPGNYTAEVYLDNVLAKTVSFKVEGDATPKIYSVVTASQVDENLKPITTTSDFSPKDTVNVLIDYKNLLKGKVKTVLYLDGQNVAEREEEIGQITGAGTYNWTLSANDGFTPGTYTVEIFLDGKPYAGNPVSFTVHP